MEQYVVALSKYFIAIFMAVYTYESFSVFRFREEKQRKGIYTRQVLLLFFVHFTCFLTICIETGDLQYLFFYAFQQLAVFAVIMLFELIYPTINRLVIHNMCMLLVIGFVMLTRLNMGPRDLIGKKIGQSGSTISEGMIKSNLEYVGEQSTDVEIIDVGFDLMTSMTTGKVDATIGCMINHEVPQMEAEGFEVQYYYPTEYGIPDYYELVFLASNDALENDREKIQKFLRASSKGFEYTKQHPEEALQILLDNQNEENFPLKKEVEQKSMDILLPVMQTENAPFLSQKYEVWQNNIDWLKKEGLIEKDIEPEDVFENVEF